MLFSFVTMQQGSRNCLPQQINIIYCGTHGQTVEVLQLNKYVIGLNHLFLELNQALEEMIGRVADSDGKTCYMCSRCGKVMPKRDKMRRHVEVHLDMTHFCALCEKTFKTRNALSHHYRGVHGQNVSYSA